MPFEDLQREEDRPKVLHVSISGDGLYHLAGDELELGEEFGLVPPFPPDRLDVMKARCASHGYTLEVH